MIATGMIASGAEHEKLAYALRDRRDAFHATLTKKLRRWTGEREAASLARYLCAIKQGIAVQAKDGASLAEMDRAVEQALAGITACLHDTSGQSLSKPS